MNIHHLELFYYVAKNRGISEAVRKMPYGIQQPAVSEQIIQLEKSLGKTLFQRRPFLLTTEGTQLYAFIQPFFDNLTMMAQNGYGITGFPPRGGHPEHLAPTNPLVMWAFTNLSDTRLTFTPKHLVLKQDPSRAEPFKLGLFNVDTWGAYLLHHELFLKRYQAQTGADYPDFGCSFEIWTNGGTLELETLSPLTQLEPGAWLRHKEVWSLRANVEIKEWNDASISSLFAS